MTVYILLTIATLAAAALVKKRETAGAGGISRQRACNWVCLLLIR